MRAVPSAKGAFYSAVPQGAVPYFSTTPSLIGTPTVGVATAYAAGNVSGNPTPTRTQQWLLDGTPNGATGSTYTPLAGDVGHVLSVRQIETNSYGLASSISGSTSVVSGGGEIDAEATTNQRYVRVGATGSATGIDWANAFTDLPASLSRNTTYWIADGTYAGGNNLNTANSGALTIRIKKATATMHGTETGWSSIFGDGQAEFAAGFTFSTNNWIVDGTTGGGPGQWESNFGFYFNMPASGAQDHLFGFGSSVANITVKHCDTFGRGRTYSGGETDLFYLVTTIDNLKIQYNLLRDVNRTMILSWPSVSSNILVEYNKFARNGPEAHRELWSAGSGTQHVTFRYNLCEDILGTGFIALVNNSGTCDDWGIYGNIFYHTGSYPVGGIMNTGVILTDSTSYNPANDNIVPTNWRVYNNIIANLRNGSFSDAIWFRNTGTNTVVRNNIFYNNQCTDFQGVIGASDNGYNWHFGNTGGNGTLGANDIVGSANPFASATPWTSGNWALSAAIAGQALASPYNIDMLGVTRGADGAFDRGAIEFAGVVDDAPTTNQKYVRQGASGTASGNDWTNAYTTLPATLNRNTTYWVADGTYTGYTFDDANSGTLVIRIKKATPGLHGTSTGWLDAYGDGEALFSDPGQGAFYFSTSYYTIDGSIGSGTSGYGIRVINADRIGSDLITLASGTNHLIFKYMDASQQVFGGGEGNLNDVFYGPSGGNNLTVQHCYLHDTNWFACVLLIGWSTVLFEYNQFANNYRKECLSSRQCNGLIWRHNFHKNVAGTAILNFEDGQNIDIYGNVCWNTDASYTLTEGYFTAFNSSSAHSNWRVFNNTFVGIDSPGVMGPTYGSITNVVVDNNIFYNNSSPVSFNATSHNFNWSFPSSSAVSAEANGQTGSGSPFVNAAAGNFHLAAATNAGGTKSAPFNVDPDGKTRGSDGTWDRGAYEYP